MVTRLMAVSTAKRPVALSTTATPVMTSWVRARSVLSIARASSGSAGLPSARPSMTTIVSAPSTTALGRELATTRAFRSASRATASRSGRGSSVSSTSLGATSNATPRDANSSRRRGEADARISGPAPLTGGESDRGYGGLLVPHGESGHDQRMGVGDDARLGVDRRADVLGDAEGVLMSQTIPVAEDRRRQSFGNELVDDLRRLGPGVDLLGRSDEAPRRAEAGDEGLVRRDHREDFAQRAMDRREEVEL